MPDSLFFDGSDDKIVIGSFPANVGIGAMTILAIVKLETFVNAAWDTILGWNSIDGGLQWDAQGPPVLLAGEASTSFAHSAFGYEETEGWALLGYGKAAGSAVPRFHKYVWGTSTWIHSPALSNELAQNFPALTLLRVSDSGAFPGAQLITGNLLVAGIWNSNLSDGTVESLITGTQAWIDAAPAAAWRFDSASTLTTIAGSTTQTSRTGTTLDSGDVPAGWTDAGGDPPQIIRPDADIADGGWITAPLWSKVDESSAGGDVISATAS